MYFTETKWHTEMELTQWEQNFRECSGKFVQLNALSVRGFAHDKAALCFFLDPLTNFKSMKLWEVDRKKAEAILFPHKQQRS
jgi:hypothetical protein